MAPNDNTGNNELLNLLAQLNLSVEGGRGGLQGLPALFLNRNYKFDLSKLLDTVLESAATAPQVDEGIEYLYKNVPQAARIIETARKNPVLRTQIIDTKAEPFLRALENKLKTTRFNKEKSKALQQFGATNSLVQSRLENSVLKTKALQDYLKNFSIYAKRNKGSSQDLNKLIMAKMLEENPKGARLISEDVKKIIDTNQIKPGLARVHGNVDRAKLKNIINSLKKNYTYGMGQSKAYSEMAKKLGPMGKRLAGMSYKQDRPDYPRINITKALHNFGGAMNKESNLITKLADLSFLFDDMTPVIEKPKGKIIRKRNFDEDGSLQKYIEDIKEAHVRSKGFKAAKKDIEDGKGENGLINYIIMMDKD